MIKAHKIRLIPTKTQQKELFRAFAASRHAWNFGKEILDAEYRIDRVSYRDTGENYKLTHHLAIKKIYNRIKPDWVRGTGTATQEAFEDISRAIRHYWDIRTGKISLPKDAKPRRDGFRNGWLHWRRKGHYESFRMTAPGIKLDGSLIRYSRKVGFIKMSQPLRFEGKVKSATFSYDGVYFWVSIPVEVETSELVSKKSGDFVGVDLGIKTFAVLSRPTDDGTTKVDNPRAFTSYQNKLKKLQQKLDRQRRANNPHFFDEKGRFKRQSGAKWVESNRMRKTRLEIRKLHIKIANIRKNTQHNLTKRLTVSFENVAIEDLNVRGMVKNKKLSKHISDVGLGEVRRQLEYKSEFYKSNVIVVDRFFPSSKTCSDCGRVNSDLKLSDRVWVCPVCQTFHDRDENAATNIEIEGRNIVNNGV